MFSRDKEQLEPHFVLTAIPLGSSTLPLSKSQSLSLILKRVLFDSFPLALPKVSLRSVLKTIKISLRPVSPQLYILLPRHGRL